MRPPTKPTSPNYKVSMAVKEALFYFKLKLVSLNVVYVISTLVVSAFSFSLTSCYLFLNSDNEKLVISFN